MPERAIILGEVKCQLPVRLVPVAYRWCPIIALMFAAADAVQDPDGDEVEEARRRIREKLRDEDRLVV